MEDYEEEPYDLDYEEEESYGSEESITGKSNSLPVNDATMTGTDISVDAVPDMPEESMEVPHDPALNLLFPWVDHKSNVITRHVGIALKRAYQEESKAWSWEMSLEFRHTAPTLNFSVWSRTGSLTNHVIGKNARAKGASWVHFWFLRVMFGPRACSRQVWFAELAEQHPWMLDEAPRGVVPWNARAIIGSGRDDWAPAMSIRERPWMPTVKTSLKREAGDAVCSSRAGKMPRASPLSTQETTDGGSDGADVWAQLDAAKFDRALNGRTPSKTDEELERLKASHQALWSAHSALCEKHNALVEKHKEQEEKLEKQGEKQREQVAKQKEQEEKLEKLVIYCYLIKGNEQYGSHHTWTGLS